MRRSVLVPLSILLYALSSFGQFHTALLIDPDEEGGFEVGPQFSDNSWTVVNGSQANTWHLGTAATGGFVGKRGAYISSNIGHSWGYDVTDASVVHFYRDVVFPENTEVAILAFRFIGVGQSTVDKLRVSLVPASTPILPGVQVEGNLLRDVDLNSQWGFMWYFDAFEPPIASGTKRLVFSWVNDDKFGTQPPIAVDDILLGVILTGTPPLSGTYTIDQNSPNSLTNFQQLGIAFLLLNLLDVSGSVTFNIPAGQEFQEILPPIKARGTPTSPIVVQKDGTGENPILKTSGLTNQQSAGIHLAGTAYLMIDGFDIVGVPNSVPLERAVYVTNRSATEGAQHNALKNFAINIGYPVIGIEIKQEFSPDNENGTNSDNLIDNVKIANPSTGVMIDAHAHASDIANKITHVYVSDPILGGIKAIHQRDLEISSSEIDANSREGFGETGVFGIRVNNMMKDPGLNHIAVLDNIVDGLRNVGGSAYGIEVQGNNETTVEARRNTVSNLTASGSTEISSVAIRLRDLNYATVERNTIGPVVAIAPGTSTAVAVWGENVEDIHVEGNTVDDVRTAGFGSGDLAAFFLMQFFEVLIVNNRIRTEPSPTGSFTGTRGAGVKLENTRLRPVVRKGSLSRTGNPTVRIDFNSIRIGSVNPAVTTSCLDLRGSDAVHLIRNNILANFSVEQSGPNKHYAIRTPTNTSIGATGSVSDRNVLHIANPQNGFIGGGPTMDYPTMQSWRTAYGQDANSFPHNPQFVSATDLRINPLVPSPASDNGSYFGGAISDVTTDIEGNLRHISTPDIGAYEGDFTGLFAHDVMPLALINPTNGEVKAVDDPFSPTASFFNPGASNETNVPVRFRITGPAPGENEVYNQTSTVSLTAGEGVVQVTFPSTSIATPGVYTVTVSTELETDQNPANDQLVGTLEIGAPLAPGTYSVGSSSPAPYNTLSGVIQRLNIVGIDGPVTILLEDELYSAEETFPIVIRAIAGSSETNTVTIKPAASLAMRGAMATIEGSSLTAVFKFEDAKNIIIDGSATGGTDRSLTVKQTSTGSPRAVFWLSSSGVGGGCKKIVIKNVVMSCGADMSTSSAGVATFGIVAGGPNMNTFDDGIDNDDNQFVNNEITRVAYGIHLRGGSTNRNDNNVMVRNVIGPTAHGPDQIGRIGIAIKHQHNATVSENVVRFVGGDFANTAAGVDRVGIGVGADSWLPTATVITNSTITRNLIHDLIDERVNGAVGIILAGSAGGDPAGSKNLVANNMISNLRSNGTATGNQAVGIGISSGNFDRVVFNTISMTGDMDPGAVTSAAQSAVGIRISSTTVINLTLKNNIMSVDVNSNTSTLKHFAIVIPASNYSWSAGGSNYNNYFVNSSNPQMVLGGFGTTVPYSEVSTLEQWRLTSSLANQDSNSISKQVHFASASDLHLVGASVGDTMLIGTPISGVVDDFDGDIRFAPFPYMGADEVPNVPLPITLASFTVSLHPTAGWVLLEWTTLSEINNYGFFVERRRDDELTFLSLPNSFVPGQGTTLDPHDYWFIDSTIVEPGLYHYRLRQVDLDGTVHFTHPVSIAVSTLDAQESVPHEFALYQNYPNPFNPETMVVFTVAATARTSLELYNVLGQRVATLFEGVAEPGEYYRIPISGRELASGLYFYRLTSGEQRDVKKLILTK